MKHQLAFRKLGRDAKHRWAMLRNMVTSLIHHERIQTTLPKAKELRRVAEQVVTMGKKGTPAHRGKAQGIVRDYAAVEKLFVDLASRYANRNGGYTRILKTNFRKGDNAEMAVIEFVDRPGELRRAKPVQSGITSLANESI